jgi:hypothetical protein
VLAVALDRCGPTDPSGWIGRFGGALSSLGGHAGHGVAADGVGRRATVAVIRADRASQHAAQSTSPNPHLAAEIAQTPAIRTVHDSPDSGDQRSTIPEYQPGQAQTAAEAGTDRRSVKDAAVPTVNCAKRTARPVHSIPLEGAVSRTWLGLSRCTISRGR